MDEESFFERLVDLKEEAYKEVDNIRPFIQELVPTYTYKKPFKRKVPEVKSKEKV